MKNLKTGLVVAFAATVFCTSQVNAQISMPAPSPLGTVTQRVGLTDITVKYSRPSTKGRKIFGEVVGYGKGWRTGANNATLITFADEVTIEGTKVPAGEYALYTIPTEHEWTVVLNKNTKLGGNVADYKEAEDVARFKVKPTKANDKTETFTINFADLTPATANLEMLWDKTSVKFKITTEVESKVMAQIQEKVINGKEATPATYASAAVYYFENNKDTKLAQEWIKKANEKDPKFWNLHTQAKIEAKNKEYKAAIKTAEKSKELAKAANNDDYVRMNDEKIAEWKKLK
ncbi:DUF2911 domain-containing protein [Adhaeribacter terreus]|uniref:DUF2911 domain-containing protein n=1 Tax=Adhaeribacter terreus TaxID=529703 RepID=A0ABW0EAG3_9BACT